MSFPQRRSRVFEESGGPILVTNATNVRYLTGFTGSNAQLLLAPAPVLLTDGRYATQSAEQVPDVERVIYEQNAAFAPALREVLSSLGVDEISVEAGDVTLRAWRRLVEDLSDVRVRETTGVVEGVRARKDADEIAAVTRAQRLAEQAVREVMGRWSGGTEIDLALELEWSIRTGGADGLSFDVIVASGPHAALPHARPRSVPVEADDVLLIDIGARVDGYCSDMTRTWINQAADPMPKAFAAVIRALEAACGQVLPGVRASDVDRAARDVLEAEGFGPAFVHSTGHAVGLDVHETPRLAATSDAVVEEGMVLTIEPGVYLPGIGGIRVEDLVVVRADGIENLTALPRDPV